MTTIGVLIFEQADELDFTGPWEALRIACKTCPDLRVVLVGTEKRPLRMEMGMQVTPDFDFTDAPALDVVIVPGGTGAQLESEHVETRKWLGQAAAQCRYLCSVCTGAFLLAGCGLVDGRRITTHHDFYDTLRSARPQCEVVEGMRLVRDGNVVTAGGIMSGFDLALWLVRALCPAETEAHVRNYLAYDTPPARAWDV